MSEAKTAIRTIEWTVEPELKALKPHGIQDAGVQGEHNATLVRFRLPEDMVGKGYIYDVEHVTSYGEYDVASNLPVGLVQATRPNAAGNVPESYSYPQVECLLPEAWTQHGGEASLRLVVYTEGTDEERMVAFTAESRIRYKKREALVKRVSSVIEETVRALLARCHRTVEAAEVAGEKAVEDTKAAQKDALSAINVAAASATQEARGYAASAEAAAEKAETKVESLIERNNKQPVSLWVGTKAEYDAITQKEESRLYLISDEALSDYANPHNLFDNSDFTNAVNQRGRTSIVLTEEYQYFIDRWLLRASLAEYADAVTIHKDGIRTNGSVCSVHYEQRFAPGYLNANAYTVVAYYADGSVEVKKNNITHTDNYDSITFLVVNGKKVAHVALYEGVYTAEQAPAYRPKGYAAELAECQRYYRNINKGILNGYITGSGTYLWVSLPFTMRKVPDVTCYGTQFTLRTVEGYYKGENIGAPTNCAYDGGNYGILSMQWDNGAALVKDTVTVNGVDVLANNNTPASLEIRFGGGIELSADY